MESPPQKPGENPEQDLTQQIARLTQRVYRLESALRAHGISVEEPSPQPVASVQPPASTATRPAMPPTPPPPLRPAPPPPFLTQQPQTSDNSLESRIGSQWFNRIGILAVLIAMAWFLKLAIDNHWIGPSGRVLIGIVAGVALIAWSERFRSRGFAGFSYSLKAVGSGILYLSLWAAYSLFHLIPSGTAFAAMIAVTAFNGFMAWSQDSELLALYAIVGGYGTPLLLSNGQNHEVALFSYLLLLNAATLVLIALRPWSRLLIGSFIGTIFFFAGWWFDFYASAHFGVTAFYLSLFFLLFSAAPHLVRLSKADADSLSPRDSIALIVLPFANAALAFLGFYELVTSVGSSSAAPWIAVAFAAFYLFLLRVPNLPRHAVPVLLRSLDLVIAVVFLTIAIPLKTHGRWLTIGWLIEGAVLLWLTRIVPQKLLWALSLVALALGLGALLVINPAASTTILFNQRFATYLVGIAVFAFIAVLALRSHRSGLPNFPLPWQTLAALSVLIVNALILISISLEIHNYWWMLRYSGNYSLVHDYRMYAQFTYSAFFMLFGAALLFLGFVRNSAFLRWQALVLLAISIGKVFLVDISELSQGYRIFSFLALGILLLAVSFAYQRDWLSLRGSGRHNQ